MIFDEMLTHVIADEGGARFVDHPADPGGATRWGISLSFARYHKARFDLDGDGDVDAADIRILGRGDAEAAYRDLFWDRIRGDDLPPWLGYAAFDMAVNQGVGAASRTVQRAVGARPDGVIGPRTLAAANAASAHPALATFTWRRCKKYAETRNFNIFGSGWMRRAIAVHDRAAGSI